MKLIVQNVGETLSLINWTKLDVIYHPHAKHYEFLTFLFFCGILKVTILFFDVVRNGKHYTDSWLFKVKHMINRGGAVGQIASPDKLIVKKWVAMKLAFCFYSFFGFQ